MKKFMKRFLALVMAMTMTMAVLTGCSKEEPKEAPKTEVKEDAKDKEEVKDSEEDLEESDYAFKFNDDGTVTDSAGRTVELPEKLEKIVPAGNPAQMVLYSIVPEKMAGWTSIPSEETQKYMKKEYIDRPEFGAFYGKKANMNLEEIIKANPDIIIDVGEYKDGIEEDMDSIQEQTGIPTIFLEGEIGQLADMYRTLGKLVDKEEEGKLKADYIRDTMEDAKEKAKSLKDEDKVKVYFGSGENGLATNAKGSIHADVLDLIGAENVYEDDGEKRSSWEDVSMEQVITWNPEVIILTDGSNYDTIMDDPVWESIEAVKEGRVYETPAEPYNWLGRPPMVNRVIGIKWAGNLLYPELYDYNMIEEAQEFYKLFYDYDLTEEEARDLMANSTFK